MVFLHMDMDMKTLYTIIEHIKYYLYTIKGLSYYIQVFYSE